MITTTKEMSIPVTPDVYDHELSLPYSGRYKYGSKAACCYYRMMDTNIYFRFLNKTMIKPNNIFYTKCILLVLS